VVLKRRAASAGNAAHLGDKTLGVVVLSAQGFLVGTGDVAAIAWRHPDLQCPWLGLTRQSTNQGMAVSIEQLCPL